MLKDKKFKIEYLIYIFILLSPILDASSCLIGYYFPNISISPTLALRPLIPLVLLGYVFFKDKKERKLLVISAIIYVIYGIIHLLITNSLLTGISFGTIFEEITYVINYTYNIYLCYLIYYFSKNNKLIHLNKFVFCMLIEYLVIIYFSIITKTSFNTYIEGMGYRSYFLSGNSISTILILLFGLLISKLNEDDNKNKIISIIIFLLLGIYLLFLVGTRTGMLGFLLVIGVYLISLIILYFIKNKKLNKKMIIGSIILFLIVDSLIIFGGSETLKRRELIKEESSKVLDINTGEYGYTTGDTSTIVWQIKNDHIKDGYMDEATKKSYLELYEYANEKKINANDNRKQQLIYHLYMIKNQKNILYILFGNGRIVHYGEIIMEMEIPCILFNFGIFGFILYICPFIVMLLYIFKKTKFKKININYIMYVFSILLGIGLSFIAGYVFFSSTCALIISILLCLLYMEV